MTHEIRIEDVEIISMLMPSAASASNMSAATPGWLFIPAPTSESFAIASSVEYRTAPMSVTIPLHHRVQPREVGSRATVNERSVRSA